MATTMCSSRRSINACPSISCDINESAYSEQPFRDLQSTNMDAQFTRGSITEWFIANLTLILLGLKHFLDAIFIAQRLEILRCDHLYISYLAVLSCGNVHYVVQGGFNC